MILHMVALAAQHTIIVCFQLLDSSNTAKNYYIIEQTGILKRLHILLLASHIFIHDYRFQ